MITGKRSGGSSPDDGSLFPETDSGAEFEYFLPACAEGQDLGWGSLNPDVAIELWQQQIRADLEPDLIAQRLPVSDTKPEGEGLVAGVENESGRLSGRS